MVYKDDNSIFYVIWVFYDMPGMELKKNMMMFAN
jgi:hypothetical protein